MCCARGIFKYPILVLKELSNISCETPLICIRTSSMVTEHKTHNTTCFVCVVLYVLLSVRKERVLMHIGDVFECYTIAKQVYGTTVLHLLYTVFHWIVRYKPTR